MATLKECAYAMALVSPVSSVLSMLWSSTPSSHPVSHQKHKWQGTVLDLNMGWGELKR